MYQYNYQTKKNLVEGTKLNITINIKTSKIPKKKLSITTKPKQIKFDGTELELLENSEKK